MDILSKSQFLVTILWACILLVSRAALYISFPIAVDLFHSDGNNSTPTHGNNTDINAGYHNFRKTSVYFLLLNTWACGVIVLGFAYLLTQIICPNKFGTLHNFPKKKCFYNGVALAFNALLFIMSISGTRVPPYLTGILGNVVIPLQFLIRFIILRKKPTVIKAICAAGVALSELVCLVPSIFPSMESSSAHKDEGGATGIARVLWPLCFCCSMIPFAISNAVIEGSVQEQDKYNPIPGHSDGTESKDLKPLIQNGQKAYGSFKEVGSNGVANGHQDEHFEYTSISPIVDELSNHQPDGRINMIFYSWVSCLGALIIGACLFWVDIIPGFGSCSGWEDFTQTVKFDFLCIFGMGGCSSVDITIILATGFVTGISVFAMVALVYYSEGSAFAVITLSLRTPIIFLFWSLFTENPFKWHPHTYISTWMSIGALLVMLPCLVFYEMGDKWMRQYQMKQTKERELLLPKE